MTDRGFLTQLEGYGLTTAEIHFYRPDAPSLLQLFVWQEYDLAPDFPVLFEFLDHWRREIEAPLHSVRIAHDKLVRPTEWRPAHLILPLPRQSMVRELIAIAADAMWSGKNFHRPSEADLVQIR